MINQTNWSNYVLKQTTSDSSMPTVDVLTVSSIKLCYLAYILLSKSKNGNTCYYTTLKFLNIQKKSFEKINIYIIKKTQKQVTCYNCQTWKMSPSTPSGMV